MMEREDKQVASHTPPPVPAEQALPGETCRKCGRTYDLVWTAPDQLWLALIGTPGSTRCPDCFDALCRERGFFIRWIPKHEPQSFHESMRMVRTLAEAAPVTSEEDSDGE